jgi:Eco57I restriction endonuclease.
LKLPNLDNNIKCGNSLIEKEEYSKNSFVWEKEFNEIFNEGGFDIVIGNPPYLSFQISSEKEKEYIKENYQTAYRNYDIYVIFTEKAINLLKQSGEFGYIIPNKFILSQYGKKLREILNDFYIRELIDFDDTQIFASAKNYTCILLVKKEKTTSNTNYLERIIEPQKALSEYSKNKGKGINYRFLEIERENMTQWRLISKEESLIFSKLDRFDKFINISKNIYEGARPGYEQGYIVSSDLIDNFHLENEILRPFIKSEDIDAFLIDWKGVSNDPKYVIFPYKEIESGFELLEINDYPNTKNYLQRYKDELYDNSDKGGDELRYRYYHLPKELKEDIKIVTPDIAKENEFAIIKDPKILFPNTIYAIDLSDHIKANKYELLGILNSKLIEFYIKIISPKVRGGYHRYKSEYLEQLPMTNLNVLSPLFKELILNVINKKKKKQKKSDHLSLG